MENIKYVLIGCLMVIIITLIVLWSGKHDDEMMKAGDAYELCVKSQTHMTVAAYYDKWGYYPLCGAHPQENYQNLSK